MPHPAPTIAVLDDEPQLRKALRRLLLTLGFRVVEYASGEALLATIDSLPLDCLLLDLEMPGITGFEVLEAFRCRRISVPVIVITAKDDPGTADRVLALGASAYLKKPVHQDALVSALAGVNVDRKNHTQ